MMGNLDERLWGRFDVGDCWEWTGAKSSAGYGYFWLSGTGKSVPVHRFVWETLVGPIPVGIEIDHLCRNVKCSNPDHLEPVSKAVNRERGASRSGKLHQPIPPKPRARKGPREHCKNNHPYDENNLYVYPNGTRMCRICHRANVARYKARKPIVREPTQ